jgi:hypothetical protein
MTKKLLSLLFVLALAAAVTATALARQGSTPTLVGTVGPGYKAGKYKLVIHDKASIHAWSLDGPHGYAKDFTQIPFVGSKTFAVTFKAGKYKFYCPSHESQMFGRFTAT